MSTFHGGPADGEVLSIRASPALLRVTKNPRARKHKFDALDQPEDTAEPHEELYAYTLREEPFAYHMKAGGGMGGYWSNGVYDYLEVQPADEIMRDFERWLVWCKTQPIGPVRAGRLEAHVKEKIGHPDPLRYCRSYFHWRVSSLAELTEAQGKELLDRLKVAMPAAQREIAAEQAWREALEREPVVPPDAEHHQRYRVEGLDWKPCRACGEPIAFVFTANRKKLPVTRAGYSHYLDCTDPKRFSHSSKKQAA